MASTSSAVQPLKTREPGPCFPLAPLRLPVPHDAFFANQGVPYLPPLPATEPPSPDWAILDIGSHFATEPRLSSAPREPRLRKGSPAEAAQHPVTSPESLHSRPLTFQPVPS